MADPQTLEDLAGTQCEDADRSLKPKRIEASAHSDLAFATLPQGRAQALPADVERLVVEHGASLPCYYDLERAQALASGLRRWPMLQSSIHWTGKE
jgi:hypothetical protein